MRELKTTYEYTAFGLRVCSEIKLPELSITDSFSDKEPVTIQRSPEMYDDQILRPYEFRVAENRVSFFIPDHAIFHVIETNKIIACPIDNYDENLLRLYLLGTCMGIILMKRKILPLHGSCIEIDNKAYLFVGDSGAGKSTLASSFLRKGYKLLSDDVIPVYIDEGANHYVIPSYPNQKLWKESLNYFGMNADGYQSVYDRESKYSVPVSTDFCNEVLPLSGVFELVKAYSNGIEIEKVRGISKLRLLLENTYRNFLVKDLGLLTWHLSVSSRIASSAFMYQIKRPIEQFTVNEIADKILKIIQKETSK